jgi:hypothetical protein
MNIFVLDEEPRTCAEYHCDKHVVKMILETAQMMCTVLNELGHNTPYKSTHSKHPCTLWLKQSLANYNWTLRLVKYLNREYQERYNKTIEHKSWGVVRSLPTKILLPDTELTPFAQAMPDEYKNVDPVIAYRTYYINDKKGFATWKNKTPSWWTSTENWYRTDGGKTK